jgi:hypothetical protein
MIHLIGPALASSPGEVDDDGEPSIARDDAVTIAEDATSQRSTSRSRTA